MPIIDNYLLNNYLVDGFSVPDPIIIRPAVYSGPAATLSFTQVDGSTFSSQYFTCDYSDLRLSTPPRIVMVVRNPADLVNARNMMSKFIKGLVMGGYETAETSYTGGTYRVTGNAYVTATSFRLSGSNSYSFNATPEAYAYIVP